MNKLTKIARALVPFAAALSIVGCGSGDDQNGDTLLTCDVPQVPNAEGTACVAPKPIECPIPTIPDELNENCIVGFDPNAPLPEKFAGENESIFYFNRVDKDDYDEYRLHTWNNDACDSLAPESIAKSWDNGLKHDGVDEVYGAYWILKLHENYGDCANILVHKGTDDAGKDLGGQDWPISLIQDDERFTRMNFSFTGVASIFEYPVVSLGEPPLTIADASAHWIDASTLVWQLDTTNVTMVKLHHSLNADLAVDDNDQINGETIEFTASELSEEQKTRVRHLKDWPAFSADIDATMAKKIAKGQLVAVAYDQDGNALYATRVQHARLLDALYTMADNDADEAQLGVHYDGADINVSLWAPTAQSVVLKVFNADKSELAAVAMAEDSNTGIWSAKGDSSWDRHYYRFDISVYHPVSDQLEMLESTDPYSQGLATNGRYSQFVNLSDSDLKPDGWDEHVSPTITNIEDATILETHIRDFSIRDQSVSEANRGKYLAFTETGSDGMLYLKRLKDAGLTHLQVLPANDMSSVNEDVSTQINLDSTVDELCAVKEDASVCGSANGDETLQAIIEGTMYEPKFAQELTDSIREIDGFNWGYDPQHFNAPEGSYASNPEGVARILEIRSMTKALHDLGLRVSIDVVYNHTTSSGLYDNSVLDKVVPGYYHRYSETTGNIERSTCCENTAAELRMMHKFVVDSLVHWAGEYRFDGFRFDLMGHIPKATVLEGRSAVAAIDPDTYFYGEGWTFGEVDKNRLFDQAEQKELAGSEVGTFNDRPRDEIRAANLFKESGSLPAQDHIRLGLAGTLADYVLKNSGDIFAKGSTFGKPSYAQDPADIINYVSKHDNRTLWDELQFNLGSDYISSDDRVRMHSVSAAIPLMSQGIPFFQLGVDLLRSKSMDRNSYNSGDWFNYVDYKMSTNNWNMGLPLARENQKSDGNDQYWSRITELNGIVDTPSVELIQRSANVFAEFLSIRQSSPLFRITSAEEVIKRVGFHNIGKRQKQGLIVMSIDDGMGLSDLDPNIDAIVVVINGTSDHQQHTIPTAAGFELHDILKTSVDSVHSSSSFSAGDGEGSFSVPALSVAVFVKRQNGAQGAGLLANATQGVPDIAPFGATQVYLRGVVSWDPVTVMEYTGNGIYSVAVELEAGVETKFKFGDDSWNIVNYGSASLTEGQAQQLTANGSDISFTPSVTATYVFSLDVSDLDKPMAHVVNEEPYPNNAVLLRGSMNGWGTGDAFSYQGGRVYTFSKELAIGDYQFKIGDDAGWAVVDFGAGSNNTAEVATPFYLNSNGSDINLSITKQAEYVFVLDFTDLSDPQLKIFEKQFFGDTPVFIRGEINGWGDADADKLPLSFNADGTYSVETFIEAGSYQFKIAAKDWNDINMGAASKDDVDTKVEVGKSKVLTSEGAENLLVTIDTAGDYLFKVMGPDGSKPTLIVTPVQ